MCCRISRIVFFVRQKTAYEMLRSLVGSERCIRDRCYSITGQYDLLAKLYISDVDGLGRLIERDIHAIPHIRDTFTILTFEAFGAG